MQRDESVDTGPRIDLIVQTGDRYTSEAFPEPVLERRRDRLGHAWSSRPTAVRARRRCPRAPRGWSTASPCRSPRRAADRSVDVPVAFDADALVIGAPQLELTYTGTTPDGERPTRVFAQLVDDATGLVLDNQITPIAVELDGREHTVEVPLEVVSHAGVPPARR